MIETTLLYAQTIITFGLMLHVRNLRKRVKILEPETYQEKEKRKIEEAADLIRLYELKVEYGDYDKDTQTIWVTIEELWNIKSAYLTCDYVRNRGILDPENDSFNMPGKSDIEFKIKE